MRIAETLDVRQFPVLWIEVVDGIPCGQVFVVLCDHAVFHIDREFHRTHRTIDLSQAVVFNPVMGFEVVVYMHGLAHGMGIITFQCERAFSV